MNTLKLRASLVMILPVLWVTQHNAHGQESIKSKSIGIESFKLGQSPTLFKRACAKHGLTQVQRHAPEERDVMGLGIMTVQPYFAERSDLKPIAGKVWSVEGYFLSNRLVYLTVNYGLEDAQRAKRWFERYEAPLQIRKKLQDTTWHYGATVFHIDRFGSQISAVHWGGLRNSDRILVGARGAVKVANRFHRAVRARKARASVDRIRRKVIAHYKKRTTVGDKSQCGVLETVELTPGPTACDLPEKRFANDEKQWNQQTWKKLGIAPGNMSRFYSYSIETNGSHEPARIVIQARGDLDCNANVATIRVTLRANLKTDRYECNLDEGEWEIINFYD